MLSSSLLAESSSLPLLTVFVICKPSQVLIIHLQNFSSSQTEILFHETLAFSTCQPLHPHPDVCFCGSHDPRDHLLGSPSHLSPCAWLISLTLLSSILPTPPRSRNHFSRIPVGFPPTAIMKRTGEGAPPTHTPSPGGP